MAEEARAVLSDTARKEESSSNPRVSKSHSRAAAKTEVEARKAAMEAIAEESVEYSAHFN
jgi:hypothetical protein